MDEKEKKEKKEEEKEEEKEEKERWWYRVKVFNAAYTVE